MATVIEACLLTTRSKMFRQHLKCSLTAPRRAGTSSGFFFVSFYSASCPSLGDLVQRYLGQPVNLLAPWPSAAVIPQRRSTAVHFQSVERRVQRNLEGLASVRLDELTVVRRHWLFFYFLMLTRRKRGLGERGDKILRWHPSNCTHCNACRRETAWVFPETLRLKWEESAWVRHSSTWEELDKFKCLFPDAYFRSARRFGAVGSSPDFSGFFTTFGF